MEEPFDIPNDYSTHILEKHWQEVLSGKLSAMYFCVKRRSLFQSTVSAFSAAIREPVVISSYCLSDSPLREPFFPFIDIIKKYITEAGISVDELLDIAKVYAPQQELFKACLTNTRPHRKDLLLYSEIKYEKSRIHRSILALLQYISQQKPLLIVIEDIRNAGPALQEFLLFIQENTGYAPIFLLLAYTRNFHWRNEEQNEKWDAFILAASEKNIIQDLDDGQPAPPEPQNPKTERAHIPGEQLVALARLNLYFLAFEEAKVCAKEAYPWIIGLSGSEADALQYSVLNILGDCCFYSGDYAQALLHYQALTDKAQRMDNGNELSRSYRKTGFTYLASGDMELAKRFSYLDLKITEELKKSSSRMYAYFFAFYLSLRNSTNISREIYFSLMEMLKNPDTKNMYAYFCGNSVPYTQYFSSLPELLRFSDESIAYYQKNQNEFGLASAYHKKGIIFSNNAQFMEAFAFMRKSLKIREQLGEPLYTIRNQNGIGYLYYLTGNYSRAFSFFRKSLHILGTMDNFDEMTATLYNLAMVYFVTANYERCGDITDKILKIMVILNINYLPYHRIHDVYILQALCSIKTGAFAKALELLHRLRPDEEYFPWKSRFLYMLLQGMAAAHEGSYKEAISFFTSAPDILKGGDEKNTDLLPVWYYEYAAVLLASGKQTKADIFIREGVSYCESIGSLFNKKRLQLLEETKGHSRIKYELSSLNVNLDTLVKLARQNYTIGKLQNKMRDIQFINIIQTELMQIDNKREVAEKLLKLVSHHLPMEIFIFAEVEDTGLLRITAQTMQETASLESLAPILQKTLSLPGKRQYDSHEIRELFPDSANTLKTLIAIPVTQRQTPSAWLFLASQKNGITLTHDDLEILLVAAGQVGVLFEKITHAEEMLRVSFEDELSGLNNRHAMQAKIRSETLRIERTKNKNELNFSVALIDLDNFKYYNDRFGHSVGDMMIRLFSKLLINTFREIDFIVRYGGDEFVILMPETNSVDAAIPLERIYTMLTKSNYFIAEISTSTGLEVTIPVEDLISCSIGLASYEQGIDHEDTIEELLNHADQALYAAKNSGKNRIRLWTKRA